MSGYALLQDVNMPYDRELEGLVEEDNFVSYYQMESSLYNYPKVLGAGVIISRQDGENPVLKVYLALEDSFLGKEDRETYCSEVESYIRKRFSLKAPIKVHIHEKLPMTRSGKVMRSVLRNYED
ncbi:hypothetical protein LPY66_04135 [Dehalobacter sp. DCM]|uniref:AMP-binding enzyme n=1 Tax=Dehalobacter sp. DCM TaxID=2907827 RepID=UPI003081C22E|nr:hypothetical protein LPY66_04135 [Dehalobacter sp. DCM]